MLTKQIYRDKNSKDSFRLLFWIYLETKFYSLLLFQLDCCQKKDYFCKFLQQAKFTEHQAEYKENKFKPFLQQNLVSFFLPGIELKENYFKKINCRVYQIL